MSEKIRKQESEKIENNIPQDQLAAFRGDLQNANFGGEDKPPVSISVEELSKRYTDLLSASGLKLDARMEGDLTSEKASHKWEHIIISVADIKNFTDFLKSFETLDIDENRIQGLIELAAQVELQIMGTHDVDTADDDFLNLVPAIKVMAEEYKKFGQKTNDNSLLDFAELFSEYEEALGGKYLIEAMHVKGVELIYEKTFSGIRRHLPTPEHSTSREHEEMWNEYLDALEDSIANKNAHDFIRKKISLIKEYLEQSESESDGMEKKEYLRANNNLRRRIEELEKKIG